MTLSEVAVEERRVEEIQWVAWYCEKEEHRIGTDLPPWDYNDAWFACRCGKRITFFL